MRSVRGGLFGRGWTNEEVAKLAGENSLRVLASVERVAEQPRTARKASEATTEEFDVASKVSN